MVKDGIAIFLKERKEAMSNIQKMNIFIYIFLSFIPLKKEESHIYLKIFNFLTLSWLTTPVKNTFTKEYLSALNKILRVRLGGMR